MRSSYLRLLVLAVVLCVTSHVKAQNSTVVPGKQFIQISIAIKGKTCADLPRDVNIQFRDAVVADVKLRLAASQQPQHVLKSTVGRAQNCSTLVTEKSKFARLRTSVAYANATSRADRDALWNATRVGICRGGYDKYVWSVTNGLMYTNGWTVSFNNGSRWNPNVAQWGFVPYYEPEACAPKPKVSPSPEPIASPSPQPTPSPSPGPGNFTSPSPAPGNETSPSPAPGNQTSPSPAPGNQTSPSPAPTNQTSPSPAPVNQTSPSPAPVVNQTSPSPAPLNQTSPSPAPGNETLASPSPAPQVNQTSPSPAPLNQTSPSPAPGNETQPSPSPAPGNNTGNSTNVTISSWLGW